MPYADAIELLHLQRTCQETTRRDLLGYRKRRNKVSGSRPAGRLHSSALVHFNALETGSRLEQMT